MANYKDFRSSAAYYTIVNTGVQVRGLRVKIAVVCSSGGHLVQSLFCLSAFQPHDVILITYDVATLTGFHHDSIKRAYFVRYLGSTGIRVFLMLMLSFVTFYRIFRKERPDVLFSTGSEIAIPAFLLGKTLFGCKSSI